MKRPINSLRNGTQNMADNVETVEELKSQVGEDGQVIKTINVLFLDISSTCTGYCIANIDFGTKIVKWTRAGAIWLDNDWEHPVKYNYMFHVISNYFWVAEQVDYIVVEQYSFNKNKMMGVQVVPEMQGAIKCAAEENGVKISSILPQTWRKLLEIKPNITMQGTKKSRDYKEPTKNKVQSYVKIPDEIVSNITGKTRGTPSDLYDALAIGLAWTKRLGFPEDKFDFSEMKVNNHIGHQLGRP